MRRFLILAVVVVVLGAALAFALGQWLARGQLRGAVEARLTATLGQPVTIGRLGVSVFPRLALSGRDVHVGEARTGAPAVDIGRVRIVPRLRPLLSGDIVVEQIELDEFVVSVLRDEKGQWYFPSAVPAPTAGESGGPAIERLRVTRGRMRVIDRARNGEAVDTASIDGLDADVKVEARGLVLSPITGRIGEARISGNARTDATGVRLEFEAGQIRDQDLPVFLGLLGTSRPAFLRLGGAGSASVQMAVPRASGRLKGKGRLTAAEVVLEPLRLREFEAPFTIDGSRLQFSPTSFGISGGSHRGIVTIQLAQAPPAWSTDSSLKNVAAGDFLDALTGRDQRLDGTASLTATLRGRIGEPLDRTVSGRTQMTVGNGVIRDFPLIATITRTLRLSGGEGNDTQFERLSGTLTIANGAATTDDLLLEAGHVRVAAAGRIGVDRSLDLQGSAVVSAERAADAVASVRELARLRNSRGEFEVPLTISGTLDAPSFQLDLNAAVRKGLGDELRRRLRRFIR